MNLKLLFFGLSLFILSNAFTIQAQIIRTIAGSGIPGAGGEGAPATATIIQGDDQCLKYDASGNLYYADGNRVRKINTSGIINTVAGSTTSITYGDGGPATAAELGLVYGIAFDASGNLYFSDAADNVVRKVSPAGIISAVVGNVASAPGYTGDGFPATAAELNAPAGITFDAAGNLYIADVNNNVIRKVNTAGIISTFAGSTSGFSGYSGDGHHADSARFDFPVDVAFDAAGNLYVSDQSNNVIRKINTSGIVSTYAGNGAGAGGIGTAGYSGDGFAATLAELHNPAGIVVDGSGNLLISDAVNDVVRKVNTMGIISTVAGDHSAGYIMDGVPATSTEINTPSGITVDAAGDFVFVDQLNYRIRAVGAPVIPSMSAESGTACQDSCLIFTNTSVGAADSIRWSAAGTTIGAPHSNPVSICFPTLGAVTVTLTVYSGGTPYTTTSVVTVNPVPNPVVTRSGHTLSVPAGYTSYQWFNGASLISGATSNTYTSTTPGYYTVVADSGGCYGAGYFSTLGVQQIQGGANIALVPNPNTGIFTVKGNLSSFSDEKVTLQITNMIGNVVYEKTTQAQQGAINEQISLSDHLPNGMYLLKLSTGQEVNVSHFVMER